MLALAPLTPLFGAVLICWIFSVCIHEFAHALVAYWGGDRSVRDKGYLHFNILSYVHPVTSILIPIVFLAMGGLPLPGGAVYIERHRLRSKHWEAAVSAAGPAANFLLFLILAAVIHPGIGIIDVAANESRVWVALIGALATLQLFSVFFNLIPIPPLDGFGIIEPYLSYEAREKARRLGWGGLFVLFFAFASVPGLMERFMDLVDIVMTSFGLPFERTWRFYNIALFGSSG